MHLIRWHCGSTSRYDCSALFQHLGKSEGDGSTPRCWWE